jgi:hypothetical protein
MRCRVSNPRRNMLLVLSVAMATGCASSTKPLARPYGVVRGLVLDDEQRPVPNARIVAYAFESVCGPEQSSSAISQTNTALDGTYSLKVGTHVGENCAILRVQPSAGSILAEKVITAITVQVRYAGEVEPIDTVTVNVSLVRN